MSAKTKAKNKKKPAKPRKKPSKVKKPKARKPKKRIIRSATKPKARKKILGKRIVIKEDATVKPILAAMPELLIRDIQPEVRTEETQLERFIAENNYDDDFFADFEFEGPLAPLLTDRNKMKMKVKGMNQWKKLK